jgi:hypothetical protein
MDSKYKEELQPIYEMSLSPDIEAKTLAMSLFWTSEYVKNNNITPKLQLAVTEKGIEDLRFNIDYYIGESNSARYPNFSCILEDLISGKAYFIKRIE